MSQVRTLDGRILGIDLGTTNSCAVYVPEGQDAVVLQLDDSVLLESMVFLARNGAQWSAIVGRAAETEAVAKGQLKHLITRVKSYFNYPAIGRAAFRKKYAAIFDAQSHWLDPEDVASFLLRYIKLTAELANARNRTLHGEKPEQFQRVVLGIPAAAGQGFRLALKRAADLAGFEYSHLVAEPVAGCMDYVATRELDLSSGESILVIDIGAGTTDVSLVTRSKDGTMDVELTDGDMTLGGDRIDSDILRAAQRKAPRAEFRESARNMRFIREFKEKVNNISEMEDASRYEETVFLTGAGGHEQPQPVSLRGAEALSACAGTADLISGLVRKFLGDQLRLNPGAGPIREVLLLGGASRMRAARDLVSELTKGQFASRFRLAPGEDGVVARSPHDPRSAVARGLARIGADWRAGRLDRRQNSFTPRLPHDSGIAVVNESRATLKFRDQVLYNSVHFPKHSSSGKSTPRSYYVPKWRHGERVECMQLRFLMGGEVFVPDDVPDPAAVRAQHRSECECIGEFDYQLKPPRLGKYVELEIHYSLDEFDGLMTVVVRDLGFQDHADPKNRKDPERMEDATKIPLTFGAITEEEAEFKRERNAHQVKLRLADNG